MTTPNTPALPSASTELAAIRDALAKLPAETLGTWRKLDKMPYIHVTEDPKASPWKTPCIGRFDYMDTAEYMVACNPAAMTAVLAYVDALQAEIQALRADARRLDAHLFEARKLLDERPAINAGLFEAYSKWTGKVYSLDWLNAIDAAAIRAQAGGDQT